MNHQEAAKVLLYAEISKGGVLEFTAPTGMGKIHVLIDVVKNFTTLFVSNFPEMREQFRRMDGRPEEGLICAPLRRAREIIKHRTFAVIILSDRLAGDPSMAEGWGAGTVIQLP